MPLSELNITLAVLPWIEFITNITDDYMFLGNDSLILFDETYLGQLNLLLAGTPKR